MTSGIYRIRNKRTGKEYIGQSKNIEQRFKQHKNQLKNRKHTNKELQADYNRGHSFSYEIIKRSSSSDRASLDRLEEDYIKRHDSKRKGYNRTWGGRTDKYASAEYRKKQGRRSITSTSRNYRNNYSTTRYKSTSLSSLTYKQQEVMRSHFEKIKRQNEREKLEKVKRQQKNNKTTQRNSNNYINQYRKTNNNNISYKPKNPKATQRIDQKILSTKKHNKDHTKLNGQMTKKEKLFYELYDHLDEDKLTLFTKHFHIYDKFLYKVDMINYVLNNYSEKQIYQFIEKEKIIQPESKKDKTFIKENKKNNEEKNKVKEIKNEKIKIPIISGDEKSKKVNKKDIKNKNLCPNCKKEIDASDNFCIFCGKQIKKQFCPNCKNEVRPTDNFCTDCGTKL